MPELVRRGKDRAMYLYLIRHAHAAPGEDDPSRALSPKGRTQIRSLIGHLKTTAAFAPTEVWHSSLTRSRQTARLLAKELSPTAAIHELPNLEPDANPRLTLTRLRSAQTSIALVGHEPHLSALASLLVNGSATPVIFKLRKSTVLALKRTEEGRWLVRWQLAPELLAK